jgi:hypothetical protein
LESRPKLTRKYWELWAPAIGLQIADAEFTEHCLQNHPGCGELNPIFGSHPSRARLYSNKIGLHRYGHVLLPEMVARSLRVYRLF